MAGLRKIIAQRMVESLQVSAQLTSVVEVDLTEIAELRNRTKADFEAREGVKLSFFPFLVKAALEALKEHPKVNASIDPNGSEITYHDAEHLGVAVDTEKGLYVPVIRDAGDMSIAELSRQIAEVAARTRSGKIKPEEMSGGTFTITNTGSRGALFDTPIINQPQVAILGTGAIVRRPAVVRNAAGDESIDIRSMAYLALSYDHRLVDGADAARYLSSLKTRLETADFAAEVGLTAPTSCGSGSRHEQSSAGCCREVHQSTSRTAHQMRTTAMTVGTPPDVDLDAQPIDQLTVNTIRVLAMDAVQAANSGHPGTPMALAPVGYTLWTRYLRFDPELPVWANRDRFVLSAGHASTLLYALLHLSGVKSVNPDYETIGTPAVSLDDLNGSASSTRSAPGTPSTGGPPGSSAPPARSAPASRPASAWRSPGSGRPRRSTARATTCSTTTSTPSPATAA